ncbi:hypothetical protein N9423_01100 [Alphaproteobacteria bacterium]|nr:hypothetical protein [Alphaproteobacteria bacterium]
MIKKNLLIYSAFIFIFIIQNLSANEIISRHLYNVGDQVKYKIDRILPNESSYITESNLINIIEDKEIWDVKNSPSADKRIFDRLTGNWIKSYKDGNEIARAIPFSGGLKFPLKKGDKWNQTWTFTAAGGLLIGQSKAEFKVKKDKIKINNTKYTTLQIEMINPLWNSEKDKSWKKHIRWIEINSGKIVKEYVKNIGFKMEYTASIIE